MTLLAFRPLLRRTAILLSAVFLLASALVFFSCTKTSPTESTPPELTEPYPWPTSSPQAQGLDAVLIATAIDSIRAKSSVYCLLVVKNDYLVVERYNSYYMQYNDFEIRSASKSFTSALIGIAIREGFIRGVDQKMMEFFPEYDSPNLDPRKREITIEHLLTMKSGLDYTESDDHSGIFNEKTNWLREAINLRQLYNPGERFNYASVNTNILAGIIAKASKMSAREVAQKYLFGPMKISDRGWDQDPQGYHLGGTGMYFTPRDLARFGYLYLHNGTDGSRSVVPAEWVAQSLQTRAERNFVWGTLQNVNYGYQWWTGTSGQDSLFFAAGFGGQFIIVAPRKDMVIVTTANPNVDIPRASEQEDFILSVVTRYILPAATR